MPASELRSPRRRNPETSSWFGDRSRHSARQQLLQRGGHEFILPRVGAESGETGFGVAWAAATTHAVGWRGAGCPRTSADGGCSSALKTPQGLVIGALVCRSSGAPFGGGHRAYAARRAPDHP